MAQATEGVFYQFFHEGEKYSIHEDEFASCYPSLSGDGSYYFTLRDGTFFRGERVQEVMRKSTSPLEQYRQQTYR